MSPSTESRARLAAQQATLVSALMARGEPPADFDGTRLRAAIVSLARKRARAVARAWPGLALELGRCLDERFAAYAADVPLPRAGGPLADGRAFARWLADRGELPEVGRLQALAVDLRFASTGSGLLPRRGPTCRIAWLRRSRRLVVAVRLPWLGERWLSFPRGWRG